MRKTQTSDRNSVWFGLWLCLALVCWALPAGVAYGLASEPMDSANVTARLVSASDAALPGEALRLGVLLEHEPTWHTYWTNPGVAGLTTKLAWDLPEGVVAGEVDWPTPIKFGQELEIIGYGYEGDVLLPVSIEVPADFSSDTLSVKVTVSYLACAETCIPGRAELSLEVPVVRDAAAVLPSDFEDRFDASSAAQPMAIEEIGGGTATAWRGGDGVIMLAVPGGLIPGEAEPEFLPAVLDEFDGLLDQAATRGVDDAGQPWVTLTLTSTETSDVPDRVAGLVAWGAKEARRSVSVDVPVGDAAVTLAAAGQTGSAGDADGASSVDGGLLVILASAVLGGVILNLMPCVFPVLALKVSAFVGQAGESRAAVLRHGLAFGGGVLVSFWAIAAAVLLIKAGGQEIGWGFQLQNPVFVGAMAIVVFAVGLNFAGVFDVGVGVMNAAGKASGQVEGRGGLAGSFGSGVLATALATPCSAPFLATSVGYAMTAPAGVLFAVLTAMGLGMALPYVLLSAFPSWLNVLPRPGAWMETFKQFMAFPMFAVAAWLVWVFNGQTGGGLGLPGMLGALVLVAMGLWALGRFGVPGRGVATRWAARLACLALVLSSAATVVWAGRPAGEGSLDWQPWSQAAVAEARAAGRPVFIDFTADWCATCKFNERVFIDVADVQDAVTANNVAIFKADWTRHDEQITAALAAFDVASVPYYVFYAPEPGDRVVHFDSVFSTGKILDALAAVLPDE
ncbi:MAG: thioredoxin family protein [Planctomycetota bacterium]